MDRRNVAFEWSYMYSGVIKIIWQQRRDEIARFRDGKQEFESAHLIKANNSRAIPVVVAIFSNKL